MMIQHLKPKNISVKIDIFMKEQEDGMMKNASNDGDASMLQTVLRIRLSVQFRSIN